MHRPKSKEKAKQTDSTRRPNHPGRATSRSTQPSAPNSTSSSTSRRHTSKSASEASPSPSHDIGVDAVTNANAPVAMPDNIPHRPNERTRPSSNAAPAPSSSHDVARLAIPGARALSLSSPKSPAESRTPHDVIGSTNGKNHSRASDGNSNTTPKKPAALADSQTQLSQYRERLARDLEKRETAARGLLPSSPPEKTRAPPSQDGIVTSPPLTASSRITAASTESGGTVRGGYTPGPTAATPSYPFPRMNTPGAAPGNIRRGLGSLSPSAFNFMSHAMSFDHSAAQDKILSGSSTPASAAAFHPAGAMAHPEGGDFPTPNLYDLSLLLNAEPGLDAWWDTVVQIMRDVFKAERVTLAVPADSTDIENVPWGQKATFDEHGGDELSLAYMARGSSLIPSSADDSSEKPPEKDEAGSRFLTRPGLQNRHSFTSYEENRERTGGTEQSASAKRPMLSSRSKSFFPQTSAELGAKQNARLDGPSLAEHEAEEDPIPAWEAPPEPGRDGKGRVLPVLQALDYEADPLIDHVGVTRVLERGKVIALTRSYPYLHEEPPEIATKPKEDPKTKEKEDAKQKRPSKSRADSTTKLSALLGNANANAPRGPFGKVRMQDLDRPKPSSMISKIDEAEEERLTPTYEEFEQPPPSPWSQSPAPSPAVRADPKENPFFADADATVDEDSFNPASAPTDYSSMRPPEAIGVDNSWTVLHIPLTHLLLSKPVHPFKLDSTAMEQKASTKGRNDASGASADGRFGSPTSEENARKDKPNPIAILSILSPIIPYPSNLRHSLEYLGPHLATSFSLCRHYSNLETELAGMQRKRPQTAGFGAIAADGRPLMESSYIPANLEPTPSDEVGTHRSLGGSITSPSDFSVISRSAAGSPIGTPGWEPSALSTFMEKRSGMSPAPISTSGDSYFNPHQRSSPSVADSSSGGGSQIVGKSSKENAPDKRPSRLSGVKASRETSGTDWQSSLGRSSEEMIPPSPRQGRPSSKELKEQDALVGDTKAAKDTSLKTPDPSSRRHTQLHSYGADFATSFQSLPPSSNVASRPVSYTGPSRSGSLQVGPGDMPPPSDRLKGLMLDALPAHVFVSLPQTGEVVWVNSRYLTYRGQTVADLAGDPWGSIHPEDRDEYLKAWGHSLRTGEQFSRTVRIRRFDGVYRWFYARAVASRDRRGVLMQFLGSYMDIHDQHIAELKAARQEEIEASEAKHRLLANLIPQIIFTATEDEGITFANDQWLSYTGQSFSDCLGLGFMDFVHPDDLAKCRIPPPSPAPSKGSPGNKAGSDVQSSETGSTGTPRPQKTHLPESNLRGIHQALSRHNSSSSGFMYELPTADLTELAKKGIIKVTTDSSGRLSYTTEVRLRSKNDEYRWHLIRCVEIDLIDFGRGASSFFGSATDINDHKLLEAKLKEAMESKSRFLSNMSHEIRTPLIGISGMVSFLQDSVLNEEQRDYTNTIQTSANSLLMIINDILDLSKVDAGMMKLKHEWFHTRALIEDVNELVSTMAIAKRLELNYVVEEDVPIWVKGDKVRIRQVLLNVIGNAIKFTTKGEVFSRCRIYKNDDDLLEPNEIKLEFAIIDTGRGFTKEEGDLIFKPFSQIDGSSTRQHGGSGLGLVISRQLVELHGGNMEGTAVSGKGSTFTFTARFTLPHGDDRPESLVSPRAAPSTQPSSENVVLAAPGFKPHLPPKPMRLTPRSSPAGDTSAASLASSASSDPSVQSGRSQITERSSVSSVNMGLVHFSQAARASGQDLSQMKLEMPVSEASSTSTPTHHSAKTWLEADDMRPPMFSILVICPQSHSREATTQHIEQVLPKDVPHQITALETVDEADELIGGDSPVLFTHMVLNLSSPEEIMAMMEKIEKFVRVDKTTILILSDTGQRQAVMKLAAGSKLEELFSENLVTFINKPVKPSRFAVIFDPDKVQDSSIDRNRSTAQRMVESQKQSYEEIEKRMGNKGYTVLLVEDNPVNQKVLMKYLKKVGVQVEVAADGVECTDMVLQRGHEYYSLILCDLHMPRKDGYQACREIRQWESDGGMKKLPIIALSANVMSDVQDKCVAAGFSDYVTKPVDFIDLSRAMSKFF